MNDEIIRLQKRVEQLEAALRLTRPYVKTHTLSPNGTMATVLAKIDDALNQSSPRCANCGYKTKHEEALVNGEIWCHSCADATAAPEQDIGCGKSVIEPWSDQSSPPVRQEHDDVFKGFRGNNEA